MLFAWSVVRSEAQDCADDRDHARPDNLLVTRAAVEPAGGNPASLIRVVSCLPAEWRISTASTDYSSLKGVKTDSKRARKKGLDAPAHPSSTIKDRLLKFLTCNMEGLSVDGKTDALSHVSTFDVVLLVARFCTWGHVPQCQSFYIPCSQTVRFPRQDFWWY